MPKPPIASDADIRKAIQKRIKDETAGIAPGVHFGEKPGAARESAPVPDITELGVPLTIRRQLDTMVATHAELGKIERDAKRDRDSLGIRIKALVAEHISDEVPTFQVGQCRVARYTQNRPSFSKDVMRDSLLSQGVKPAIIVKAMETATTINPVVSLRISAGEEES